MDAPFLHRAGNFAVLVPMSLILLASVRPQFLAACVDTLLPLLLPA
jgi:hypothetical protein